MSRIGRMPVAIPAGVTATIAGNLITVKGPKGELQKEINKHLHVEIKDNEIIVSRPSDDYKMIHGTTRALIHSMVEGVTNGFTKVLEIKGVGYRAEMRGNDLVLHIGHSHEDVVHPIEGVSVSVKQAEITITGIDKQKVGQLAAVVRSYRKPECYHGKGIRYKGENVVLRQPASAKKQAAGAGK